jgi:hypothetical protein
MIHIYIIYVIYIIHDRCKVKLQLNCPYLGAAGFYDPDTVAALNRHLIAFLWKASEAESLKLLLGMPGSHTPCTAELSCKGCKHLK